ncbi:MAG TPA: pyridoxamine 5'-phosphate oxidase family protein [Acidimicrobiales bacterium]|nr:pyridoxamine 5'-phosphate oxidase family protein [Acidimicrobiales bacterium]
MNDDECLADVRRFLEAQKVLVLATVSADGVPHACGMHYAARGDTLYCSSLPATRKLVNIAENRNVGYTVYHLADYSERRDTKLVQGRGVAAVVDGEDASAARELLAKKFPWAPELLLARNAVIRIDPAEVLWMDMSSSGGRRHVVAYPS